MASNVEEYWQRRRELSPTPDRPAVADGDRRLALLVDASTSAVAAHHRRLADRLGAFDCLQPTPAEQLHCTVKLFDRSARDGADAPTREAVAAAVTDTLADVAPFELSFPRLNLFPDTVYAEVADGGTLSAINAALCEHTATVTDDRDADQFLPHLTLGYFTGDDEYDRLVDFLETNRSLAFPAVEVTELALVERQVTARSEAASTTLETFSL